MSNKEKISIVENKKVLKEKKKFNFSKFSLIIAHFFIPIVNIIIFYFYCNGYSIVMAFQRIKNGNYYWTLENFSWFLRQFGEDSTIMKEAFLNTFMWWGIQLFLTVLGVFTSYFIYKKITGYRFFRVVFIIPGLISAVVMSFMISTLLGPQGFIAKYVQKLYGLEDTPLLLYDSAFAKKWLIIKSFPFAIAGNMLIWVGTMSRIPDSVIESAKLDGASWLVEMFIIVIPMILPVVGITLCSSISGLFSANGGEFLFTKGDYGTMTLNTYLYLQVFNKPMMSNTHHEASAVGWIMTLIIAPLVLIVRKIMNKIGDVEY